jgi:hypothetical protein
MKLTQVIERALNDSDYAQELRAKADAAYEAGVDTDEWTALMKEFAESPTELARLRRPGSHGGSSADSGTTTGTRGPGTTLTTTTTTTGYAAPKWLMDFVKKGHAKRASKAKVSKTKASKAKTRKAKK